MSITPLLTFSRNLARNRRVQLVAAAVLAAVLAAVVLANAAIYVAYRGRTYPNTSVAGHRIGSVSRGGLPDKVRSLPLLPQTVTIAGTDKQAELATADIGIVSDHDAITRQALSRRSWLPMANFFTAHGIPASLRVDDGKLRAALSKSLAQFESQPTDAKIERQDGSFAIKAESAGQSADVEATAKRLVSALEQGKDSVEPATKRLDPSVTAASLQDRLSELKGQAQTAVSLSYNGKSERFAAADIAGWYSDGSDGLALSDGAIRSAVTKAGSGWGITVQNLSAAVTAIKAAVQEQKELSFALKAAPRAHKTLTYCTAVRGVSSSELAGLAAKLQETFADARGWGLDGRITYVHRSSGCDFTVWLAAADRMPSFGAICDAEWSCAVSPNVVINYDRWRYATTSWNNAGGSLPDYKAMVINHETGHWLGFYHSYCPGGGQPAPVMQQQSINLQGCKFNPWPTKGERDTLARRLGL